MKISGRGRIVMQGEMAEIYGCTSATLRSWRRAGCPCVEEGGSGKPSLFNTMHVIRWREALAGGEVADVDLAEDRRRKVVAEARLKELELDVAHGWLLPRDEVRVAVHSAFTRVRAKLLALPAKLAPRVLGLKSAVVVQEKLQIGVHEALAELSSTVVAGASTDADKTTEDLHG